MRKTRPVECSRADVEAVVREHHGHLLASLIHKLGQFDLAEDCLQDAEIKALTQWVAKGLPHNPAAWLHSTAKNRAIDLLRRNQNFNSKRHLLESEDQTSDPHQDVHEIADERLRLIFTCCHPALHPDAQIALTLKTLCGLSVEQIASAYLIRETTLAQRIVRAKRKINTAGITYEVPAKTNWPERLDSVLAVIYLIFNEGYSASTADGPIDINLCKEAIYLNKVLLSLIPQEANALGLLSLMLFHYSRFAARQNAKGRSISLRDQDRSLWNTQQIVVADKLLKNALHKGKPGVYQIQAAISGVHAHSKSHETTDWPQIVLLYKKLMELNPSPITELNAIVALSFANSPQVGLEALAKLEGTTIFSEYQPWYAAKADLLARNGDISLAKTSYAKAITLAKNTADKAYLSAQMAKLG